MNNAHIGLALLQEHPDLAFDKEFSTQDLILRSNNSEDDMFFVIYNELIGIQNYLKEKNIYKDQFTIFGDLWKKYLNNYDQIFPNVSSKFLRLAVNKYGKSPSLEQVMHILSKGPLYEQYISIFQGETSIHLPTLYYIINKLHLPANYPSIEKAYIETDKELKIEEFEKKLKKSETIEYPTFLSTDDFNSLNGKEFEEFLFKIFKLAEYLPEITSYSKDQGADLILTRFDEKIVVQAKRTSGTVGNKAVQEITAAIHHYGADHGMIVTNSGFTKSAILLAHSNNIELWDGRKLEEFIEDIKKKYKNEPQTTNGKVVIEDDKLKLNVECLSCSADITFFPPVNELKKGILPFDCPVCYAKGKMEFNLTKDLEERLEKIIK